MKTEIWADRESFLKKILELKSEDNNGGATKDQSLT